MQVDEMEGRELDVLVAEKVMGDCGHILADFRPIGFSHYGPNMSCVKCRKSVTRGEIQDTPHYSTDIAAILPVAEQVVGTGHIKIKLMPPDEWNELYLAQVALWLGYIDPVRTAAEAATGGQAIALALARAVVKAKETTP